MNLLDILKDRNTTVLPAGNVLLFRCSRASRRQSIFNSPGRGRWFKQVRFAKGCGIRNQFVRVYETGLDADWRYGVLFFKVPVVGTEQFFYQAGAPLVRPHQREDSSNINDERSWNLAHTTFDSGEAFPNAANCDTPVPKAKTGGSEDGSTAATVTAALPDALVPSPDDAQLEWHWLSSPGVGMPVKWCKSTKQLIFDCTAASCNGWFAMPMSGSPPDPLALGPAGPPSLPQAPPPPQPQANEDTTPAGSLQVAIALQALGHMSTWPASVAEQRPCAIVQEEDRPLTKRIKLETGVILNQEKQEEETKTCGGQWSASSVPARIANLAPATDSAGSAEKAVRNEAGAAPPSGAVPPPQPTTAGELLYLAGAHPAVGPELEAAGPMPQPAGISLNVQHPAVQAGIYAAQAAQAAHHQAAQAAHHQAASLPWPHHFQAPPPHPGMMMPHLMGQHPHGHAGHYMPPFPGMYPGHAVSWAYPPPPPQHLHWHPGRLHEPPAVSSITMLPPVDMLQAGAAMPFVPEAPQHTAKQPMRSPFGVNMLLQAAPAASTLN